MLLNVFIWAYVGQKSQWPSINGKECRSPAKPSYEHSTPAVYLLRYLSIDNQ
jgi:hypothetical protein